MNYLRFCFNCFEILFFMSCGAILCVMAHEFAGLGEPFSNYEKARFVVLSAPFESTTSYLKGTAAGPAAILEASGELELYDIELGTTPAERGIATLPQIQCDGPVEEVIDAIRRKCSKILEDGKFPVVLGGEHTVSLGLHLALKDFYGDVSALHLDAHGDLRDSFEGSRFSHACVMRRIREHSDAVQAGIRAICEEEAELISEEGLKVFYAHEMVEGDLIPDIIGCLGDRVHVTLDLDVLDPSVMPAVGTPEPGGLGWYGLLGLLKAVAVSREVVGFDMVELCPRPGLEYAGFTAAKLAYKMMGFLP
ncbi:MAG: agmatinase [Candidatus Altiarchaeales archaeon]|nr:agmatinase [Candidatus Altiarchaeales archaeon]MBD3417019.1 agmatinase [Candidatus Altiarchaeales archaeon]